MKSKPRKTTIVLDRKSVAACLKATGLAIYQEVVDFALRELLRHKQQKLLSLKGKVSWRGDLSQMRTGGNS